MAFEDNKAAFEQEHFTIIELDLPVVNGTCTIGSTQGYGTPLTCDQPSNGTKTYRFISNSAPILPVSELYRCLDSISENTTELQSGKGLSLSASLNITLNDFIGDPNPLAPGVNNTVKQQGTFFSKLNARNILQNKAIRVINYRVVNGELPDLETDGEVRHYLVDSLENAGKGKWKLKGKDELANIKFGDKEWPVATGGFLRQDLNETGLTLQVDAENTYTTSDILRIGKELFEVSSVSNIGTSSATVSVTPRNTGVAIGGVSFRDVESHSAGDEIFICRYYKDANIATVLYDILLESGIDASYLPLPEWQAEIDKWHPDTVVNMIFTEAEDSSGQLERMLTSYTLDMWFDPVERKVKVSAVSTWQQSAVTLREGVEINFDSVKYKPEEKLRATDAVVVYDKPFLARNNDVENFNKVQIYSDPTLSSSDKYGEVKQKRFDNNPIIDKTAAELLTSRHVLRYGEEPISYVWETEENKLNFKVGDIADLQTFANVGFDGLPSTNKRAQITQIKPMYNDIGRKYKVKALTYEPAISSGGVVNDVIVTGTQTNLNLYTRVGGSGSEPVDLTFIFDGVSSGSTSTVAPSISIGDFAAGSKITIICINGTDLQGRGGDGGDGAVVLLGDGREPIVTIGRRGGDGGIVLDAGETDVDIYLSGPTGNTVYPQADGFLRAPGGGGGGGPSAPNRTGSGGGGGAGRGIGAGGTKGRDVDGLGIPLGNDGQPGGENGVGGTGAFNGGGWGQDGEGQRLRGLAGKGITKTTGTVRVFGGTSTRFINGRGDAPD